MAGVLNKTARQYNLKALNYLGQRVTVRIAPGFNVVEDEHWEAFVSKDGKVIDPYIKHLSEKGFLEFGKKQDDMELEQEPDTKTKTKVDGQKAEAKPDQKTEAKASGSNK